MAEPATIESVKNAGTEKRQLFAVTFTDQDGHGWFSLVAAERDADGAWAPHGVAAARGSLPQRSSPWLNLAGQWGQGHFYAGEQIHAAGAAVASVSLTLEDGTRLQADADSDIALFVSDNDKGPASVRICGRDGRLLRSPRRVANANRSRRWLPQTSGSNNVPRHGSRCCPARDAAIVLFEQASSLLVCHALGTDATGRKAGPMPPFFHPVRRVRRRVTPRVYRQVRHPVRSAAWSASGVGHRRPKRSGSSAGRSDGSGGLLGALVLLGLLAWAVESVNWTTVGIVVASVAGCAVLGSALYFATKVALRALWRHRPLRKPPAPTDAFGEPR